MGVGDLCDQGRCAQILRAIAEAKMVDRVADRNAEVSADILCGVLAEFGLDPAKGDVRAAVARHIARAAGVGSVQIEGVVA